MFLLINFSFLDIVHRDLKLENILLKNTPINKTDEFDIRVCLYFFLFFLHNKQSKKSNLKVTDFGLSSKKSVTSTDSVFNDHCGTPL